MIGGHIITIHGMLVYSAIACTTSGWQ